MSGTCPNMSPSGGASNGSSTQICWQAVANLKPFFYGGVAACVAEAATFPIDTAKTRLQLQGQVKDLRHAGTPYNGMIHCWKRVATEEGFRMLYSGISPALMRQAVYGTIKYGLYYSFKDLLTSGGVVAESAATNITCAVISGAVSSAIANPTDVLKVRMQSQSEGLKDNSKGGKTKMVDAFKFIYNKEGVAGLWRGVFPTAQRAGIVAGVQLPVYDFTKVFFLSNGILPDSAYNHLISSFSAGLCACLASSPIDVVRTRLMDQRRLRKMGGSCLKIYKSSFECLTATVRNEGVSALYRGFVPAFTRMGPWNVIFFLVYERLKKF